MRVDLKGVHHIVSKGRDYYYAWRGGPRLKGKPGSPEFIQSYDDAYKARKSAPEETMKGYIALFKSASEYTLLKDSTKRDYNNYLKMIEAEFGDMPRAALEDVGARGDFKAWRDTMAAKPRKADYAWSVLARVLSIACDRGKLSVNYCKEGGRLFKGNRADNIWGEDDLARLFAVASKEVVSVVVLALWTGQRQGDLLRLPWSAYDGRKIRLRQSKTGVSVAIPVTQVLADQIASLGKYGPIMLTSSDKARWTSDGFRASFRKACAKADIVGLTFHDLRGTAVTRLALAACTEIEIAAITGHSVTEVKSILDRHYLGGKAQLAEAAIIKLEAKSGTKM